jgi:diguanylate cyclase (GGDEF)-like protein
LLSPTETAFLAVACLQIVLALGWGVAAWAMPSLRPATLRWGAYALLLGLGLTLHVAAAASNAEALRALGNIFLVLAVLALQRGVWRFFDAPVRGRFQGAMLALVVAVSWVGLSPGHHVLRIGGVALVIALCHLAVAFDLYRLAARWSRRLWGVALAAPLLLGVAAFSYRAVRSALAPEGSVVDVTVDTTRNYVGAFVYLVQTLAFQFTLVALLLTRLLDELRRSSRRDALTGLMNRGALDEALLDEAHRARRLGETFAVMMIDADHFKAINDRHGHAAGDRALQHLAALLSSQARDIDRVGRFGGEEFLMLLPATAPHQAAAVGERLRARVAALPPMWNDAPLPLTVSIGLDAWRGAGDGIEQVLKRADEALYRAKAGGRNRVEMAA